MLSNIVINFNKWFVLTLVMLSVSLTIFGVYYQIKSSNDIIVQLGMNGFVVSGLLFILKYSRLVYEKKYIQIINVIIGIQILVLILKILHYPGYSIGSIICSLGFIITYSHRFFKKIKKDLIDIAKYIWVLLFFLSIILIEMSIDLGFYINVFAFLFLAFLLLIFIFKNRMFIF